MNLEEFNGANTSLRLQLLRKCCNAEQWIKGMMASCPFTNIQAMCAEARSVWTALDAEDYREAFNGHPRIGESNLSKEKYSATGAIAEREQKGVRSASEWELSELQRCNEAYEHRFGYKFIVFASGKSGTEILEIMRKRLGNSAESELICAAEEQINITVNRLKNLLI